MNTSIEITYSLDYGEARRVLDAWDRAQLALDRYDAEVTPNEDTIEDQSLLCDMMRELRNTLIDHMEDTIRQLQLP